MTISNNITLVVCLEYAGRSLARIVINLSLGIGTGDFTTMTPAIFFVRLDLESHSEVAERE